jgi:GAF domain-containing protein
MFAPLRPACIVPFPSRSGNLLGLFVLGPRLSDEPYSSEDKMLLRSVASQAGVTLENLNLAENIADRLQAERAVSQEMEIARQGTLLKAIIPLHSGTLKKPSTRASRLDQRKCF